jgi:hypothetical protein
MPNGKVLVAGGSDRSGIALASAEIYDPSTEVWSLTSSLPTPRSRQATILANDGKVYLIAGNTGSSSILDETSSIEAFDASTETWSHAGNLLMPRQNHTATLLLDSTILITGGYLNDILSECEIFDPRTGMSRKVAPMKLARHDHNAVLLSDGKVLVLGGRDGGAGSTYINECEVYDPTSNTWSVITPMHDGRISASVVQFSDGSILVAGGRNSPTTIATGAEMFDYSTSSWNSIAPILQPCNWQAGILMPHDRYMFTGGYGGGDLYTDIILNSTPKCEWYDQGHQSWYYAPTMNLLRSEHGGVYIHQVTSDELPKDMLLVAGGITYSNTFTETCEVLDVTEQALNYYIAHQPAAAVPIGSNVKNAITVKYTNEATITLDISLLEPQIVSATIYDFNGNSLQSLDLGPIGSSQSVMAINTSNLASGTYLLVVRPEHSGLMTAKVIVSH